jgi:hypothetical protein
MRLPVVAALVVARRCGADALVVGALMPLWPMRSWESQPGDMLLSVLQWLSPANCCHRGSLPTEPVTPAAGRTSLRSATTAGGVPARPLSRHTLWPSRGHASRARGGPTPQRLSFRAGPTSDDQDRTGDHQDRTAAHAWHGQQSRHGRAMRGLRQHSMLYHGGLHRCAGAVSGEGEIGDVATTAVAARRRSSPSAGTPFQG